VLEITASSVHSRTCAGNRKEAQRNLATWGLTIDRTATDEQIEIINQEDGFSVVLASAGSGKTFVVVERYLRLVREFRVRPSQILTITFTKKAAAEMKRRIVDRLFGVDLFEQAQEAETGPIQTIHSFYERLLRENSVEAGMDPKFELATGAESDRLKRDAVRHVINSSEDDESELIALFVKSSVGKSEYGRNGAYEKLEKETIDILNYMRSSGHEPTFFEELYASGSLDCLSICRTPSPSNQADIGEISPGKKLAKIGEISPNTHG
jgi:ATP-dependent exoDNAse (exonuclease V) beta subunit